MRRCLQLAFLGSGYVAPNPMVGAVLVYQGRIIGEGYHRRYGEAHAEVNCLKNVAPEDRVHIPESTMYVSLEPCSHFGKTPPCADLIVQEKIASVKIGCIDINHRVKGRGVKRLRDAGIKVETGICEKECLVLNKRFFTYHSMQRPYVILKWAQSQNGKIGLKGKQIQISNPYTNKLVHKWRKEEASILIGNGTARTDDPRLTNRFGSGHHPIRIVLAGSRPPDALAMFHQEGRTIVFNTHQEKETGTVSFIKVHESNYLREVMDRLFDLNIQSVLVEGGSFTHQHFFETSLWDECRIITNTGMIITDGINAPELPGATFTDTQMIKGDRVGIVYNTINPFVPE